MDEQEIVYIALSNLQLSCLQQLEDKEMDPNGRVMVEYILSRSEQLMDKIENKIMGNSKPIERPKW